MQAGSRSLQLFGWVGYNTFVLTFCRAEQNRVFPKIAEARPTCPERSRRKAEPEQAKPAERAELTRSLKLRTNFFVQEHSIEIEKI